MAGTQLKFYIDKAHSSRVLPGQDSKLLKGGKILISGWVLDEAAGRVPSTVYAQAGELRFHASRVQRPDLSRHFQFAESDQAGFSIEIDTNDIAFGDHDIRLYAEFANGAPLEFNLPYRVSVVAPVQLPELSGGGPPRILLACAPKTGSTFCATFLRAYLNITTPEIGMIVGATEHLLSDELLSRLGNAPTVLQYHILPRTEHLDLIRKFNLATVLLWRNMADVVVSHDDEMDHAWYGFSPGTGYLRDPQQYLNLSRQERFQFFIRHLVPWYIGFYLSWRDVTAPLLYHYELLAVDKARFFTSMLEGLGIPVDDARLKTMLETHFSKTRFSAGVNGRANEKFSDETKALMEEIITTYPADKEALQHLVDELPWRKGAQAVLDADPREFSAKKNPMRRAPLLEYFDTRA